MDSVWEGGEMEICGDGSTMCANAALHMYYSTYGSVEYSLDFAACSMEHRTLGLPDGPTPVLRTYGVSADTDVRLRLQYTDISRLHTYLRSMHDTNLTIATCHLGNICNSQKSYVHNTARMLW